MRRNRFSLSCLSANGVGGRVEEHNEASPHYSRALLLQSPIRCCDKPLGGGLAPRSLDVLHEYASGPQASARRSCDAAWRFRDELS